jgi:serine-type D-Ala-D-Ala carboxypeptidase (penicillin-binding protein 5/6)
MSRARGAAIAVAALVAVAATAAVALHPAPGGQEPGGGAGKPPAASGPGAASPAPAAPHRDVIGGPLLARHGILVRYPATGARKLPKIPASAFVLADADTGQVLAAKDPHGLFPPASTLKVLTAISLIPGLDPDTKVIATRRATSVEPNIVGLARGRSYRVADLFRALLLISANDAAVSLAEATGSYSRGVGLMNAEARWLHADDTVARNPNGLPARGQVVSAYDEALIARQALTIPDFMRYDSTLSASFRIKKKKMVGLVNQNDLLTEYRGGLGGKIGWTEKARATYIGMARRHGVTLIVTILHCRALAEIKAGEKLLTWGFKMDHKVTPVGMLVPPRSTPNPAG